METSADTAYRVGVRGARRWALVLLGAGVLMLLPITPIDLLLLTIGGTLCFAAGTIIGWDQPTFPLSLAVPIRHARRRWYLGASTWTMGWGVLFVVFALALPPGPFCHLSDPHPIEAVGIVAAIAALAGRLLTVGRRRPGRARAA